MTRSRGVEQHTACDRIFAEAADIENKRLNWKSQIRRQKGCPTRNYTGSCDTQAITLITGFAGAGEAGGSGPVRFSGRGVSRVRARAASDFHPGAFDLTDFQVISDGTTAYLRATLANLDPTFGADFGAQLLDVYVHTPGATQTSTQAAYASRNYSIAPGGAWSE